MRRRLLGLTVLLGTVVACGGGGDSAAAVIPPAPAPATPVTTFMVFMAADNNLDPFALTDLNEMEAVGSSADVNIVVQVDTMSAPVAGSTTTKRIHVQQDADPQNVTSPVMQDLGETDTATAQSVASFIAWAAANFPADRYVLVLWDHGGGWDGYATDETNGSHVIPTDVLALSLGAALAQAGIGRLDMLGFDACLMATIEVAFEVRPTARYFVASEELEPGQGWPYDSILGPLVANPDMSMRDFAASIPALYQASTNASGQGDATTLSTVDLDAVPALVAAVDQLATALANAGVAVHYEALGRARFKADRFRSGPTEGALVDLGDLTTQIDASPGIPGTVTTATAAVRAALAQAVLANATGPVHAEASGLSIYFDPTAIDADYGSLDFAAASVWDDLLADFVALSSADVTAPTITIDQATNVVGPTPANPATVDVTITGNDAIDLQAWVVVDQGGGIADVLGTVQQVEAQPGQTQIEWSGALLALTNGAVVSALPLFPLEPGDCNIAFGFVRYHETSLSPGRDLLMFVDCDTGAILGFFEFVESQGRTAIAPVALAAGSELEVLFVRFDSNAGTTTLVPGATLEMPAGVNSLAVAAGPAASGSYGLLVLVTDIAGNRSGDAVDITVP